MCAAGTTDCGGGRRGGNNVGKKGLEKGFTEICWRFGNNCVKSKGVIGKARASWEISIIQWSGVPYKIGNKSLAFS